MSNATVLVVEDEPLISSFLVRGLREVGYAVELAERGDTALSSMQEVRPDLVLLDLLLPGCHGLEVLRSVRATDAALPVIILTALGDVDDRVRGLDCGATDYLVKPFAFTELAARVAGQLRIAGSRGASTHVLAVGALQLDLQTQRARFEDEVISLSVREFGLLEYLMRHPGQVLSRQQLLDGVWGYDFDPRSNIVDVYVGCLRRKLDRPGHGPSIETVRGMGYRLPASRRCQ